MQALNQTLLSILKEAYSQYGKELYINKQPELKRILEVSIPPSESANLRRIVSGLNIVLENVDSYHRLRQIISEMPGKVDSESFKLAVSEILESSALTGDSVKDVIRYIVVSSGGIVGLPEASIISTPQAHTQPQKSKSSNSTSSKGKWILASAAAIAVILVSIFVFVQISAKQNDDYSSVEQMDTTRGTDSVDNTNGSMKVVSEEDVPTETIEEVIAAVDKTSVPSNLSIGQRGVVFGEYTWRVLDVQDGKALLLSEEIIERREYYSEWAGITWEESVLREYLNGSFLQSFTQEEQDAIVEVTNINDDNQWYGTEGGNATQDKIFLLSIEEVITYFGDSGQLENGPDISSGITDQYNEARQAKYGHFSSWWWLRSPGGGSLYAALVIGAGDITLSGYYVYNESGGVRPALWINQ